MLNLLNPTNSIFLRFMTFFCYFLYLSFFRFFLETSYVMTRIFRGHYFDPRPPHKMAHFDAQLAPFGWGSHFGPKMGYLQGVSGISKATPDFIMLKEIFGNILCHDQDFSGPLLRPPFTTQNGRFRCAIGTFWRGSHSGA